MLFLLVIFTIISNVFSVIAFNLYKMVSLNLSRYPFRIVSFGIVLQIIGTILDILSLQYGPQSLKACISTLPMLINLFIEPCIDRCFQKNQKKNNLLFIFTSPFQLKYKQSKCTVILTLFLVAGIIISGLSFFVTTSFQNYDVSYPVVVSLVTSTHAIVYQIVLGIFGYFLGCIFCCFFKSNIQTIIILSLWASISSSLTALFLKTTLHLLYSPYSELMVTYGALGLYFIMLYAILLVSTIYFHKKNTPTQIFITIFTSFYIIINLLSGGIVYNEFNYFVTEQWIMFSVGICLSLISLLLLGIINYTQDKGPGVIPL